jgi:hypothetical protein
MLVRSERAAGVRRRLGSHPTGRLAQACQALPDDHHAHTALAVSCCGVWPWT